MMTLREPRQSGLHVPGRPWMFCWICSDELTQQQRVTT